MEIIYLVGQISPKFEETYKWRENVTKVLKYRKDIKVIDPCCNSFNKKILKEKRYALDANGNSESGINVLPSKDLTYVLNSTIAIVNLNQYDPSKELLGSYYEMGWLYLFPEKTVIAFSDNLKNYNCRHPFVTQTVDTWCKNEKEACFIINKYF